jgi:UDP-glucose 4-epimerase
MNVIVTGGAGFVGCNLVRLLQSEGARVLVIDDLSTGFEENIPTGVEFRRGDVGDLATWKDLSPVDYVFHLAAMTSVVESQTDPVRCEISNVHAVLHLLEYAKQHRIRKIIFASSAAVYGDGASVQEESQLPMPKSPYGLSKLSGEHLLYMNHLEHRIPFVAFRMFNIFGPFQSLRSAYASVIPIFFHKALLGEDLGVHGDGKQTRDFVFVEQVVRYYLQAVKGNMDGVYNLGSGTSMEINSLAQNILKKSDRQDLNMNHTEPRPGDIRHSRADISRLKKDFVFEEGDFNSALDQTHRYYRSLLDSF